MQDIRKKICNMLNMPETTNDMQLLNALRDGIKKYYPAEVDGEEGKKVKSEEFQKLHDIYKKYKQLLDEEKKNNTSLTVITDEQKNTELTISQELDKIQNIINTQEYEEHISRLQNINKNQENEIRSLKEKNKSLETELYAAKQDRETGRDGKKITEHYKKGIRHGNWGLATLLGAIATIVPQIKDFLTDTIGVTASSTITTILIAITIVLLINSGINAIKSKILDNTTSHFKNPEYLEKAIEIIPQYPYSTCTTPNYYISKKDINNAIRTYLLQGSQSMLFKFDIDHATEHIVNSIVLHYMEFNVIEAETTEFLDTLFKIKGKDRNNIAF